MSNPPRCHGSGTKGCRVTKLGNITSVSLAVLLAQHIQHARNSLAEVARRPHQLGALFGLAREMRQALAALAGPAHALRLAFAAAAA